MYNPEVKANYFDSQAMSANTRRIYTLVLENLGAFEAQLGKDLGEMDAAEWSQCISVSGADTYVQVQRDAAVILNYAKWYACNVRSISYEQFERFRVFDVDIVDNVRAALMLSVDEVLDALSVKPAGEGFIEMPLAALAWMGLTRDELAQLRSKDLVVSAAHVSVAVGNSVFFSDEPAIRETIVQYNQVTPSRQLLRSGRRMHQIDLGFYLKRVTYDSFVGKHKPFSAAELSTCILRCTEARARFPKLSIATLNRSGGYRRQGVGDRHT